MTADLTRLVAKKQALRRKLALSDATVSLETQRALLRGSGERRDASQGLALTDDPSGGEVSLGQDGELGEDR